MTRKMTRKTGHKPFPENKKTKKKKKREGVIGCLVLDT
jgi:hypothetical protein